MFISNIQLFEINITALEFNFPNDFNLPTQTTQTTQTIRKLEIERANYMRNVGFYPKAADLRLSLDTFGLEKA